MNYLATRCSVFIKSQRFSFHKAAFHCVLPLVFIFQKQIQTAIGQMLEVDHGAMVFEAARSHFDSQTKDCINLDLNNLTPRPLRHTAPTLSASNWVASMAKKGGREAAKR